jgi:Cu/Ag efflux protein CusF
MHITNAYEENTMKLLPSKPVMLTSQLASAILLAASLPATSVATTQAAPAAVAPSADMADGEIRKIDKEAMKVTIKHGEIKSLDMPPMTMVFRVKDAAIIDALKTGEKIKFKVARESGSLWMVDVKPAP